MLSCTGQVGEKCCFEIALLELLNDGIKPAKVRPMEHQGYRPNGKRFEASKPVMKFTQRYRAATGLFQPVELTSERLGPKGIVGICLAGDEFVGEKWNPKGELALEGSDVDRPFPETPTEKEAGKRPDK